MRLEAGRKMLGLSYDYEPLFLEMTSNPKPFEKMWEVSSCFADKTMLENHAKSFIETVRKKKADEKVRKK